MPRAATISVITNDGRSIVGILRGYDQATNIVLDECHERVYSMQVHLLIIKNRFITSYTLSVERNAQNFRPCTIILRLWLSPKYYQ